MQKKIMGLALTFCILLTACGSRAERQDQVSLLAQAAEMEEETILLTVDGREVPAWRWLYWLDWVCGQLRRQHEQAGLALNWDTAAGEGTLAEYAREQAVADAVLYAVVENLAERYDAAAESGTDSILSAETGLTAEQMAELECVGWLYAALYRQSLEPDSALAPEETALRDFAEENGWLTVEQLLFPWNGDPEAARTAAAEQFARINGAADPIGEFTALAGTAPVTFQAGEEALAPALEDAALSLEEGQLSGILEYEDGFAILLRRETELDAVREAWFDHWLRSETERAQVEITEACRTLDIAAFDSRMQALRQEE